MMNNQTTKQTLTHERLEELLAEARRVMSAECLALHRTHVLESLRQLGVELV